MSLRGWLDGDQGTPAVPQPVPVPAWAPFTDPEDGPDLARDVLVHWALPLLARARRCADSQAGNRPHQVSRESWELLADDIAALIGHSVTDQRPADELAQILVGEPSVLQRAPGEARLGTRGYFLAATNRGEPAPRTETTRPPAGPLFGGRPYACDGCGAYPDQGVECLAPDGRHTWRPLPNEDAKAVHATKAEGSKSSESATPTTPQVAPAAARQLPRHDLTMPHAIGPAFASTEEMIAWERGTEGCPPRCPRRLAAEAATPEEETAGPPPGPDDDAAEMFRRGWKAAEKAGPGQCGAPLDGPPARGCPMPAAHKSSEPAAPVPPPPPPVVTGTIAAVAAVTGTVTIETPADRATRLDREAKDAQRAYAAAVQAADGAWREIGGRP